MPPCARCVSPSSRPTSTWPWSRPSLGRVRERALDADVAKSLTPGQQVIKIVHEELVQTLGGSTAGLKQSSPPLTILMVGPAGLG
jgi:signal recognition particle subunit SRP54